MGYQPVVPLSGISGWRFLQRTAEKQQAAFESSAEIKREMTYFRENIASVKTAEDLVANRRLLKVALTAFGLEGEIDKKAFIRKVLEEGTGEGSMAARLNDPSWKNFSAAFGFDGDTAKTGNTGFADKILTSFKTKSYEIAVGKANDSMRLAMNFKREIADLAAGEGKSWYNVLGNKALRKVFEGAFGLPTAFAQVDLDQQVEVLREKTSAKFGGSTLAVFQDATAVEKMIDTFLVREQMKQAQSGTSNSSSASSGALTLLQGWAGSSASSSGLQNLLTSFYKS